MGKKTLKTIKEDNNWRNIESIDLKNLTEKQNKELIKKAENWKLPWYHVVDPEKWEKFLRSNPDRTSKNNLDPKLKIKKK